MVEEKSRQRRFHAKTRNGCLTCKKRRVKCDERKPICGNCERTRLLCDGYQIPKAWIFEPSRSPASQTGSENDATKHHDKDPNLDRVNSDSTSAESSKTLMLLLQPQLRNADSEAATLMTHYVDMISLCPMAWDTDMFRARGPTPIVSDTGVLMFPPVKSEKEIAAPMKNRGHLALAVAALHLFEPERYPPELHYKYLQMAVVEIRSRITKQAFMMDDLLQGISKTFLATVLHGDEISARAHLTAATHLVNELGGLHAIDSKITQLLRYGDMHLAVETLKPLCLGLPFDVAVMGPEMITPTDSVLAFMGTGLLEAASNASLPHHLTQALLHFIDAAAGLAQVWATERPPVREISKLDHVGIHAASSLYLVVGGDGNLDRHCTAGSAHNGIPITFIMWIQILLCAANSEYGIATIQGNVLPLLSSGRPSSPSPDFPSLKPHLRKGLAEWNKIVFEARQQPRNKELNEWQQLVPIAIEMEKDERVQLHPFMHRLLHLREKRISKRFVLKDARWGAEQFHQQENCEVVGSSLTEVRLMTESNPDLGIS